MSILYLFRQMRSVFSILAIAFLISCGFVKFTLAKEEVIPQQVLDLRSAAQQQIQRNDTVAAREEYQAIIRAFPGTSYALDARRQVITLSLEAGDRNAADTELEALMRQDTNVPGYADTVFEISRAYRWAARDPVKGRQLCKYLLEKIGSDPRASGVQCAIVKTYMEERNRTGADAALEKYKQLCTGKSEELKEVSHLVEVYINDFKCPSKAAELYQWYLNTYPQHKKAALLYSAAIELNLKLNKRIEADEMLSQMIDQCADQTNFGDAIYATSRHYRWLANDYAKGRELYMLWLDKYGNNPNAYQVQGGVVKTYLDEKDIAGADAAFEQFKDYCKDQPGVWDTLSKLAAEYHGGCKRPDRAMELYRWFRKRYPNHGKAIQSHCLEIRMLLEANRNVGAKDQVTYLFASKDHSDFVRPVHELGPAFSSRNDFETALEIYTFLRDQLPNHERAPWFQRSIVQVYMAMEDHDRIDEELRYFLTKYITHPKFVEQARRMAWNFDTRNDTSRIIEVNASLLQTHPQHDQAIWIQNDLIKAYLEIGATTSQLQTVLNKLLTSYSSHRDYAKVLNNLGDTFRSYGRYADSIRLYQTALDSTEKPEQLCAIAGTIKAQIRLGTSEENTPDVQATVEKLIADYAEVKGLGFHVFQIGEEYYFRAEEALQKDNKEQALTDFKKAIAIWEINRTQLNDSYHDCLAYYHSAIAYNYLEDYWKAIEYFEKVAEEWPEFTRRWHALSMIAECYSILKNMDKVPIKEANQKMYDAYKILVSEYPDLPASKVVKGWVDSHSKAEKEKGI